MVFSVKDHWIFMVDHLDFRGFIKKTPTKNLHPINPIFLQSPLPLSLLHPRRADFAAHVAQGAGGRQTYPRRRTQLT